jgi:hypothetical protein
MVTIQESLLPDGRQVFWESSVVVLQELNWPTRNYDRRSIAIFGVPLSGSWSASAPLDLATIKERGLGDFDVASINTCGNEHNRQSSTIE